MAGFTLTPTPIFSTDREWNELMDTVKNIPGVYDVSRKVRINQVWVGTTDSKQEFEDALKAAGINASVG